MPTSSSAFVKQLAHNDAATRMRAFESLKQFLTSKSANKLQRFDLEKLWKGLYFAMWYCDKPVPQQSLAGDLGKLFSEVILELQLQEFHEAFWVIMQKEWHALDKWRVDKFLMLIRRVLRHYFFRLDAAGWPKEQIEPFLEVLNEVALLDDTRRPMALPYHLCDIYLDEIEYVVLKDFRDYSEEEAGDEPEKKEESDDDSDSDSDEDEGELNEELLDTEIEKYKEEALKPDLFYNPEVDDVEPDDESTKEKKLAVMRQVPIELLCLPFKRLLTEAKYEPLAKKCKEVIDDERYAEWNGEKTEGNEEEEEWTGF